MVRKLKVVAPQKLGLPGAKAASNNICNYFQELEKILNKNSLLNAPERIFNVDESGLSTEHSPPKIVCAKNTFAQAILKDEEYYYHRGSKRRREPCTKFLHLPGKRLSDDLLDVALQGSAGGMSDNGWINRGLFQNM
ncbi:hypothetical protein DPMN_084442 [Dreissena polymorpha]|uniref:Uncharacterized protein n=1 Tax=Dreissena polymorpha TaxID=45954 RepID=A0A9D3YEB6_DREPO|nr:hypothetical protein DPMN_084442 [Dreissena polymorpha]